MEQVYSGTAYYDLYKEEDFQLTFTEASSGTRFYYSPEREVLQSSPYKSKLVLLDGEYRPVVDGSPEGLIPFTAESRINKRI